MKKNNTKIVVGLQWGDEGKGKITNFLSNKADVVVRYQGGNNAGHTIKINNQEIILNHLPSGITNPQTINVLAQGMVINLKHLCAELDSLQKHGINNFQLRISKRAHIIMPYHIDLDKALEKFKSRSDQKQSIGTTRQGIGPAYEDKMARIGLRFSDFQSQDSLSQALDKILELKNKQLAMFNLQPYQTSKLVQQLWPYAKRLSQYKCLTSLYLQEVIEAKKHVIFEGAQGVMLCIDNGTYPYVTASSPTAAAAPLATGLNLNYFQEILGVVKAYTSRVGQGPLVSNLDNEDLDLAHEIRERGHEYGSVSGRNRRIGWLDIIALKHAIRVSGASSIALTLLDVLSGIDILKIVVGYKYQGKTLYSIPSCHKEYQLYTPIYEKMVGWKENISHIKNFNDLPQMAQNYVSKIASLLNVPIKIISVGPSQEQTIVIT